MRKGDRAIIGAALSLAAAADAFGQSVFAPSAIPPVVEARRASGPVVIDGRLDDERELILKLSYLSQL